MEKDKKDQSSQVFKYRHYRNVLPVQDEYVVVEVTDIVETGAYVELLEYSNRQGMITPTEYTKMASVRAVNKAMKKGKEEVVLVMNVDYNKGFIDLSKKRVNPEDVQQAQKKYTKSRSVHSIVRNVSQQFQDSQAKMDYIYENIVWPLYEDKYEHALDAFQLAVNDNDIIMKMDVDEDIKARLLKEIQRRLTPQQLQIRADFELYCFSYEGIDAIKEALQKGQSHNSQVKFQVISAPLYIAYTNSQEKGAGIKMIQESLKVVENTILEKKGKFVIKEQVILFNNGSLGWLVTRQIKTCNNCWPTLIR